MQFQGKAGAAGVPIPSTQPRQAARPALASRHDGILCLDDFEDAARGHLPRQVFA
ncbi:MAG: alpha-hydroxy-acid oxidizing protein, partial [Comamonadaceae bacterium]